MKENTTINSKFNEPLLENINNIKDNEKNNFAISTEKPKKSKHRKKKSRSYHFYNNNERNFQQD